MSFDILNSKEISEIENCINGTQQFFLWGGKGEFCCPFYLAICLLRTIFMSCPIFLEWKIVFLKQLFVMYLNIWSCKNKTKRLLKISFSSRSMIKEGFYKDKCYYRFPNSYNYVDILLDCFAISSYFVLQKSLRSCPLYVNLPVCLLMIAYNNDYHGKMF